ncbi:MAG: ATP-binding protein [Cyclobacteriaceae bacterium]|nr:ATP-binding protein [Cyclobacteriaceae bacterium HetDA_MAG_MS6]
MIELKWAVFQEKFSGKEQEAFQSLAYELFCQEHNQPFGIPSHHDQTGIEADPIKVGEDHIGFQAKYLEVKPSDRKPKLIRAFQSAKSKNSELTKVYFYLNKSFHESRNPNQKKSQVQIEIEEEAKKLDIELVWKVPSQLQIQLSQAENQRIYNRYFTRLNLPSSNEILEKFESSSFHLRNIISHFEGLEDSHIPRKETKLLLDWIKNPLGENEKGIILLVGNAGYGKSVITKDLYEELHNEKVPVLGIKADKYYTKNKKELQEGLDFDVPIETLVETLAITNDHVVILIDQIDALSQSMSAKREYLDAFQSIINSLASISGVRIIISIRTYDLNYDADLRYYTNQKSIKVGLLDPLDVQKILVQKEIDQQQINPKLLELIRIPHHLNVLCKVSTGNQTLHGIQTLHDLYNELWYQKITQYTQGLACREAIYEIASQMHNTQSINLSKFKIDEKHFIATEYLKSNALLVESKDELQFFHQTFFDYCFAKQFVERQQSVESYILNNHQGLYIRASLKMIMSFLRDQDLLIYTKTLVRILKEPKFRHHVKVLLITEMGFREDPNELEKDFVSKNILFNNKWKDIFIESINTSAWLEFVNQKGELEKRVLENTQSNKLRDFISHLRRTKQRSHKDRPNQVYHLFRRLLPTCRHQILQIIQDLPDFSDKPRFVYRLLYFIEKWDNPLAIQLFEKYADKEIVKDTYGFYKILADSLNDNISWVLKIYGEHLKVKIKTKEDSYDKPILEHEDCELFEKLFDNDLVLTFDFALKFVKSVAEKVKYGEVGDSRFSLDLPLLFAYNSSSHDYYERVYRQLIDKAREISIENSESYKAFIQGHLRNNSLTILLIVAISLKEVPERYTDLILDFLIVLSEQGGFGFHSKFEFHVRELIMVSYPHFTKDQREEVNRIILAIDPGWERQLSKDQIRKKAPLWFGKTKYTYLCAVPIDLLFEQPLMKRTFQELERKFGKFKEERPRGLTTMAVPPPLPTKAYENMSFDDWENSFLLYDDNYVGSDPLMGSKLEHSRSFKNEVVKRPDDFESFIEKLINENKVDLDYVLSGLNGLAEGNHASNDFRRLFKKILHLDLNRRHTLDIIRLTDYLSKSKNCDDETVTFLCNLAINHKDPTNDEDVEDLLQYGINTVRGAAAFRLSYLRRHENCANLIFDTVEKVLEDPVKGVKSTVISSLYELVYLDKERTLRLFLKIVEEGDTELLIYTERLAQHLAPYYFEGLIPYFKKTMELQEMHGGVAFILAELWINNQQEYYGLLKKFLKKSEDARSRMIDVAVHYLFDENLRVKKRAEKLFLKYLNSKDEKVIQAYSTAFLRLNDKEEDTFDKIYPLLLKYSNSNVVKSSPHHYYEYLLSNAKKHPKACIDLVSRFKYYQRPDVSKSGYYDDDPVKILLGAYNSLRSANESDNKYKEKSMEIFDQLLMDDRFRLSANKVTDRVEG